MEKIISSIVNHKTTAAFTIKKDKLVQFYDSDIIYLLEAWYYGSAMGNKYVIATKVTPLKIGTAAYRKTLKVFKQINKLFPVKAKKLYRVVSPKTIKNLKKGKTIRIKTSKNVIQSWTESLPAAKKFYKDVYQGRRSKQRSYFIVSAKLKPLTNTEIVKGIINGLIKHAKYLGEQEETDKILKKQGYKKTITWCKSILKRLNSKMIKSQKENIVEVKGAIRVKVEEIFL